MIERVTTSWDDGHPADLSLAERLDRHGLKGTFFVPVTNREGRPVMAAADLRTLARAGHEIAAHTLDHHRLVALSAAEARRQIADGKARLEDLLGSAVTGFSYPGGRAGRRERALVAETGFSYARTTRMLCLDPGPDPLWMGTTLQMFPHGLVGVLRNWARQGCGWDRLGVARCWLTAGSPAGAVRVLGQRVKARGGVLHLWGHSWEIERHGLWPMLDAALAALAALPGQRLTNAAVAETIR